MIEAVIFDMDGLMVDTQRVWDEVIDRTAADAGLVLDKAFHDAVRGSSSEAVVAIAQEWLGPDVDALSYVKQVWVNADAEFEKGVDKKPGLDELLVWLKEHDIPMAVASGSKMDQIKHHLEMCGIEDCFDVLISGFEVEHAKPAPDVFLAAAERLGADPARTIVLEDSFNGILAAAAGGFIPVMVPDVVAPTDEIRGLCWAVCDSLADVIPLLGFGRD